MRDVPISLSLLVVWFPHCFFTAVPPAQNVSQHDHPNAHALAQVSTKRSHRMLAVRRLGTTARAAGAAARSNCTNSRSTTKQENITAQVHQLT